MISTELTAQHIDELLGPSERRYFGARFKLTRHCLAAIEIDCAKGLISSHVNVIYPGDWSAKSGLLSREPHLSTIDLLATCAQLCDAYLFCHLGLTRSQSGRVWMRQLRIRAGRESVQDLSDLTVIIKHLQMIPDQGSLCGYYSEFEAEIGGFTVSLVYDHPVNESGYRFDDRIQLQSLDELMGYQRSSYYGTHYCNAAQHLHDIHIASDRRCITGKITVTPEPTYCPSCGLGSSYDPHYSALDLVIGGAQLCQALLYEMDGLARDVTENLWMRAIEIQLPRPLYRSRALQLSVAVERTRALRKGQEHWRTAEMRVQSPTDPDVFIQASLAHKLPPILIM